MESHMNVFVVRLTMNIVLPRSDEEQQGLYCKLPFTNTYCEVNILLLKNES